MHLYAWIMYACVCVYIYIHIYIYTEIELWRETDVLAQASGDPEEAALHRGSFFVAARKRPCQRLPEFEGYVPEFGATTFEFRSSEHAKLMWEYSIEL